MDTNVATSPLAGSYHPDVRLRLDNIQVDLSWDGSARVHLSAELLAPDGTPMGHGHAYTHRFGPHEPEWAMLMRAIRPAFEAHHGHLGLNPPAHDHPEHPIHLHPKGHPALPPPAPVGPAGGNAEIPDVARVAERLTTMKVAETGLPLDPAAHPLLARPEGGE